MLAIPEVLGYAKIAGMPVVTGLYTLLLPMAVFALVGSSRHLVVGADSATAAMMAAGVVAVAAPGSSRYVALAGLVALLTAVVLLLARLVRLGFLGDFLSRTVLIGFLTGVGITVAIGQLPDMLGVPVSSSTPVGRLSDIAGAHGHVPGATPAVSVSVIAVVLGLRAVTRRAPAALVAVIGAIVVSGIWGLQAHGVAVLGAVPSGLPSLGAPTFSVQEAAVLLPTMLGIVVVVLAQSSATARAYAARYDETLDENADLVGLGLANAAAAVSGAFVVNGSPTKTQMVDDAGGRSQLAQLTASVVVLLVVLFLTGPLAYLPVPALASIVFLIGVKLVELRALRRVLAARRDEFAIAVATAAAVVLVGVGPGIALAVVASVIDHLRISYSPRNGVLVPDSGGRLRLGPVTPGARTADGLVIYRFTATLYYANARRLLDDVHQLLAGPAALRWFCLDCVAIGDIDFTGGEVLRRVLHELGDERARLVFVQVPDRVRTELDRYGITRAVGEDAYFPSTLEALQALSPGVLGPPLSSRRAGRAGRETTSGEAAQRRQEPS